jgi:hypothetical protein
VRACRASPGLIPRARRERPKNSPPGASTTGRSAEFFILIQNGLWCFSDVRRGTASGAELPGDNELQSSTWQDNDITLFPGESQTITVTYRSADLRGAVPVMSVSGWNVPRIDVPAP